jgi:hypothetical protein
MTVVPVRTSTQTVTKSVSAAVSHRGFLGHRRPCQSSRLRRAGCWVLACLILLFVRAVGRDLHAVGARFGGWRRLFLMPFGFPLMAAAQRSALSAQCVDVAAATISAATSGCRMSEWAPANEDWDVSQMTVFASAR